MSGETEKDISGWTIDTQKEFTNQRFAALQTEIDGRIRDMQDQIDRRFSALEHHLQERYENQTEGTKKAFEVSDKAVQAALTAQEKAVLKAERDSNSRFESVNEFRAQLADQARTFMPRTEANAVTSSLAEKIDALATRLDKSEGKGLGLDAGWGLLVGAVGLIVTLIVLYNLFRGMS